MLTISALANPRKKAKVKRVRKSRKRKTKRRVIHARKNRKAKCAAKSVKTVRKRIIRVRKNPNNTLIAGIFLPRKGFQKTVYFTGESFSLARGNAKLMPDAMAKQEAKRILPMLPPKIDRIWTQAA